MFLRFIKILIFSHHATIKSKGDICVTFHERIRTRALKGFKKINDGKISKNNDRFVYTRDNNIAQS